MIKLKSFVLSLGCCLLLFSGCNSYQTLLRHNQGHSVTLRDSTTHIIAHLMVEKNHASCSNKLDYYSFKSGKIFKTQGAINGTALQGLYRELYESGELKESGNFSHGLKDGVWKSWYNNGNLKEIAHFRHGKQLKRTRRFTIDGNRIPKEKKIKKEKVKKETVKKENVNKKKLSPKKFFNFDKIKIKKKSGASATN
jgi:MORN repeat variant